MLIIEQASNDCEGSTVYVLPASIFPLSKENFSIYNFFFFSFPTKISCVVHGQFKIQNKDLKEELLNDSH